MTQHGVTKKYGIPENRIFESVFRDPRIKYQRWFNGSPRWYLYQAIWWSLDIFLSRHFTTTLDVLLTPYGDVIDGIFVQTTNRTRIACYKFRLLLRPVTNDETTTLNTVPCRYIQDVQIVLNQQYDIKRVPYGNNRSDLAKWRIFAKLSIVFLG